MTTGDPWVGVAVLSLAGGVTAYKRFQDWRTPDVGTTEWVQQLYVDGEIDEAEMERRLDVIEDDEALRIRNAAERVSGIGEQTSWDIAAGFDTLEDVRAASLDELTAVPNVGEQRAAALKDSL